jgi:PAS domain S-box-containing protein
MAIAISDSNGQILAQSFEFKRLFGPPNTGKPFLQHLAENLSGAQSAGLTDLSRHVFESGDHAEQEIRVKHHGDLSDWHVSIFPIASDSRGRVSNVCSVIEDITDRKRAEEALRKSEAHTRALISAIPDLIFTNRRDGEFLAVHAPDPKWLFLPAEAFLHQKVEDVLPRPLSDQFMAAFANALDSAAVQELNYSLPMGDQERHFEARVAPCAGDTVITIVRDITERKQAEEERRNIQAQLLQTQKMESLGSLAGGVAHDMNNVLGAILFLSSANLETLPAESPASRAFDTISKAAIRGGQMVKSLLGFARQSPAEKRELDVNLILREEIRLLEHTTLAKVHLELELAPDLRPICGDASALAHAFMNLCVNAVDAMPEHGTLTLRTRNVDNGWIEVAVEDTGCGMSKDVLEKALDPFFTTKEQGKGTGLGLSVVYRTVQAHQGQLELQSEPSQGTRVKMRFPVCGLGTLIPEPAKETLSSPSREALHILLVDDDELIRSSIQAILEAIGHITTTVVSGEEALAKLEAGIQPDLVILDMNMPGLGGGGTLPRLRALRPTLPVLLATGRADQKVLDLVEAYPGVTLLPKPFTLADIQQNIRSYKASRPVRVQPLS